MYVADTLSRATPESQTEHTEEEEILRIHVNQVVDNMPIKDYILEEIKVETGKDREMTKLREQIKTGWPANKSKVDYDIRQYFQYNEELSEIDGLIFKADKVMTPKSMRKEILTKFMKVI